MRSFRIHDCRREWKAPAVAKGVLKYFNAGSCVREWNPVSSRTVKSNASNHIRGTGVTALVFSSGFIVGCEEGEGVGVREGERKHWGEGETSRSESPARMTILTIRARTNVIRHVTQEPTSRHVLSYSTSHTRLSHLPFSIQTSLARVAVSAPLGASGIERVRLSAPRGRASRRWCRAPPCSGLAFASRNPPALPPIAPPARVSPR